MYQFNKEKHQHLIDGYPVPGITTILGTFFPNPHWTSYGRDRGSYVHQATELYDRGELDEEALDPILKPFLDGWKLFRSELEFEPLRIEEPMASEIRRFATVVDRVGFIGKRSVVLEIKSGSERKEHRLQTAGEAHICKANDIVVTHRAALYLPGDGTYSLRWHEDPSDENAFLSLVSAFHAIKNYNGGNK
jgi:hypothetical protein